MKLTTDSELAAKSFQINRSSLLEYANASGDQNPIHQNEEFAKSVGLPDVIAHGMFTMALAGKFATDWAGGSATMKEYSTRFTKPVVVPAGKSVDLIISGEVGEVLSEGLVRVDITATSDGQKVLGMARAFVVADGKTK